MDKRWTVSPDNITALPFTLLPGGGDDQAEIERLGLVVAKLQTRIARKRRQMRRKDAALLRWRRWAVFVFLNGGRFTGDDDDVREAVCQRWTRDVEEARSDAEQRARAKGEA